jgi:hypothetical protein
MWRLPRTSSYSYPRVATIWIDVHPIGETWYTRYVCFSYQSTYATHTLPADGPRTWQPFTLTQQSWTYSLLLRKSASDSTTQPGWVVRRIRLSFSPKHNHWSSALKPNIYWWTCYISLLDLYHQHVISTFNTCSWGSIHRSLTNTGGGYNLGVPACHITLPDLPNWWSFTFHLRVPPGLKLTFTT